MSQPTFHSPDILSTSGATGDDALLRLGAELVACLNDTQGGAAPEIALSTASALIERAAYLMAHRADAMPVTRLMLIAAQLDDIRLQSGATWAPGGERSGKARSAGAAHAAEPTALP